MPNDESGATVDIGILREFIALAEELSFSAAAARLYVSKSSLSKHIQALEVEIGAQLLVRDKQRVSLTEAGKNFYDKIIPVLAFFDDAVDSTQQIATNRSSILRVGYLYASAGDFIPQACAAYMQAGLGTVRLRATEIEDIRRGIMKDELDLGFTILVPETLDSEYSYKIIRPDEYGIVVPASSKLASRESLDASDLDGMTLHGPNPEYLPSEDRILTRYLREAGCDVKVVSDGSDIGSLEPALAMGASAAFVVKSATEHLGSGFKFVSLGDLDARPALCFVWKKSRTSTEIEEFIRCATTVRNINAISAS